MNKAETAAFLNRLRQTRDLYESFLGLLAKKFELVSAADTDGLLAFLKEEEAFGLKLRGAERELSALIEQFGPDATVRSVVERLEGEERVEGERLYGALCGLLMDAKEMATRCNILCELRLRQTEKKIKAAEAAAPQKPSSGISKKV